MAVSPANTFAIPVDHFIGKKDERCRQIDEEHRKMKATFRNEQRMGGGGSNKRRTECVIIGCTVAYK